LAIVVVAAVTITACGGGDDGGGGFAAQFGDICDQLADDIGDLDDPGSLEDIAANAKDAGELLDAAVDDLAGIDLPSGSGDAEDLIDSFSDRIDAYDDIAAAANSGDVAAVEAALAELEELNDEAGDLADDVGAGDCGISNGKLAGPVTPTPEIAAPTTTIPVVETVPPTVPPTEPPPTEPPATEPPATEPVTPPADFEREILDVSSVLISTDGTTFVNVPEDVVRVFDIILLTSPSMSAVDGQLAGLDVLAGDGGELGRMILFLGDTPIPDTASAELLPFFDPDGVGVPSQFEGDSGTLVVDASGAEFVTITPEGIIWVLGADEAGIRAAYTSFVNAES
jgi:hypothetical protein